jgi:hypothetical protein
VSELAPTYSPADVAKRFGVGRDKVMAWIAAGELAALNVATRAGNRPRWRICPEAIESFERRRAAVPRPAPAKHARRPRLRTQVIEYV